MKKTFKTTLTALVAIALTILSSCSSKDMLDMVPSDVDFVAVGNPDQLIKNAGFEITDTDIKGPSELKAILNSIPNQTRDVITDLHSSIDFNRIVVMGYIAAEPEVVVLVKLTDKDKVRSTIRSYRQAERFTIKGYDVYELDPRTCLVVDGSYGYFCSSRSTDDAASLVNKFLHRAKDKDITSVSSVAKVISEDRTLNIACNMTPLADLLSSSAYALVDAQSAMALSATVPYLKGNWLSLSANYEGTSLTVESFLFNEESGDRVEYPGTKEIDSNTLRLLPSNTIAAAACGIDNQQLRNQLNQLQGLTNSDPLAKELVKQLGNLDGTVAVGIGLNNKEQLADAMVHGFQNLDMTLVAQMVPGKAADLKTTLTNLASLSSGIKIENNGNVTSLTDGKLTYHLFTEGNNFVISKSSSVKESDNNIIPLMKDASSAIAVNVPSVSALIGGNSKLGLESSLVFEDSKLTFKISLTGVDKDNLYSSLMSLGAEIQSFANSVWSSAYSNDYYNSYNNYDEYAIVDSAEEYAYVDSIAY